MNIIFLEPGFPANQREFVRALHSIGAHVLGVGDRPHDWLDDELKGWLGGYQQIESVADEGALEWAVRQFQSRMWIDRMEAVVEAHVLPAAHVRERCGIPGTSARTAYLCRDKVAMKEVLRKAGVPTAASAGVTRVDEARDFVATHGFPVILKPRDAAGASGTFRAGDWGELAHAARASGLADGAAVAIEEFVEGHEGFYDTLTVGGRVACDFVSHYYPNVLEAMRTRWISPQIVATNRIHEPGYDEVKSMGARVISALGIGTSATHMEWFFGPKGLKFSEIGCRPPGVGQWDSYCAGNEFDLYREWALAVCHGATDRQPSRRYACGIVALRPERDGWITGYEGIDGVFHHYREHVVGCHFPPPGTPTQPVAAGYMANAWMRLRHPDYDALRHILDDIGQHLRVHADGHG
jgi:formate-dependent phosphoribosylglycinamide formyltransferase (GAR transformylase)